MSYFKLERRNDGVLVAGFRNPPSAYFTADAAGELDRLVTEWSEDTSLRAIVICGDRPGLFITHYSVEELLDYANKGAQGADKLRAAIEGFHALLLRLQTLPKPVVFALTGDTMGGGFEISLTGDIRVAQAGDYLIGLPETKIGIVPGAGGIQRLARAIGPTEASAMVLRGLTVSPEDAKARGLVHEVAQDAKTRAIEIASDLATRSSIAIAQAKRAIHEGLHLPIAEALAVDTGAFVTAMTNVRAAEDMAHYVSLSPDGRRRHMGSHI